MTAVTVDGEAYRVGTVVEFGRGGDHSRDGQVCVLTGIGEEPSFTAVAGPDGPATTRPPRLAEVRSAAANDAADLYEVRPRYPRVGQPLVPADVDGREAGSPSGRRTDRPVRTDGSGGRSPARDGGESSRFPEGFALAFRLAGYSAAFDRRPEGAIRCLDPPSDLVFDGVLYAERSLRSSRGDAAGADRPQDSVDRARAFAAATTEDCPRVAVPARPDERGPFASVPLVSPRVVGRADPRPDTPPSRGSGGSPPLLRALRQAWYSTEYGVSLEAADYHSGSLTVAIEHNGGTRGATTGAD